MSYPAPLVIANTVALSGSAQSITLATAPSYRGLAITNVLVTTTATNAQVSIEDNNDNVGFEATVVDNVPVEFNGEGYHFQPNAVISLNVPAGSGNVSYTIVLKYT